MKLFNTLAIATVLMTALVQSSFSKSIEDPKSDLRLAVTKLLINPTMDASFEEIVRISFFVTSDKQLVVLKTDARTKKLDQYIKNRMNYHTVDVEDLEINRIFHIKVHFQLRK
ncbi:MAG TPA: hypothetical protein VKZ56_05285 [Membranihabitans sp.]|nr:hypothetical protein [Membranihabitans sp.]